MDWSLSLRERKNAAAGVTPIYLRSLIDKCKQCFRDREYKKALGYLNEAIKDDSDPPLLVLDKKAAICVKLGDCDTAVAVARQIIKRDAANSIGYLRLGQILQCQRQQEKALKVYEKALRTVPPQDVHIKTLQSSRDSLASALRPKNAVDPLEKLPEELVLMIQHYLGFLDVVNMSRVCRHWRQRLCREKLLWTDLDFAAARRPVSIETVRKYVKRSEWTVWRCSTCRFNKDPKAILFYIANRCKHLKELHYEQCLAGETLLKAARAMPRLTKLTLAANCEIDGDLCLDILQECRELQHAEFHNVTGKQALGLHRALRDLETMHTLTLNGQKSGLRVLCGSVIKSMTNVRQLETQNWTFVEENLQDGASIDLSNFDQLESLNLAGCTAVLPSQLPSTLVDLRLNNMRILSNTVTPISASSTPNYPRLRRLSLASPLGQLNSTSEMTEWLRSNKGNHVELDLNHHLHALTAVETLIKDGYLDSIEVLKLRQCSLNDAHIAALGSRCHSLKLLDIGYTWVTGVGVKEIINRLRQSLRWLGLDGCWDVKPDAVEWARQQGIKVSFNFQTTAGKGKKLRLS